MTIDKAVIMFFCLLTSCKEQNVELQFDSCCVSYRQYPGGQKKLYEGHYMTNEMEVESARRKLALCLCDRYIQKRDSNIKSKIMEIYHIKETYFTKAFPTDFPFDSILIHRVEIFDPTIYID